MHLSGWGRYPTISAQLIEPANRQALQEVLQATLQGDAAESLIVRGAGCSYGDAALAETVLSSRHLDHFLTFDEQQGVLHCSAGTSLDSILRIIVPKGFFLPVLPGTRFVSVGGAIAADIHGKNHHQDGCFSNFVDSFTLLLASGEIRTCSRTENADLFAATCGGMGLTGIVLDACLTLNKVPGIFIKNKTLMSGSLEETFELLESNRGHQYSVAWVDCLSRSGELGRGCLFLGDHAETPLQAGTYRHKSGSLASVPVTTPGWLLNAASMRSFNWLYYQRQKLRSQEQQIHYQSYFFPLDRIRHWNRLYGRNGFIQYQLVLPDSAALAGMRSILEKVSAAGKGSFLAVLKQFGAANDNPLSFPLSGYTLTLDFKMENTLLPLLEELDAIMLDHGGRQYLAKDARMSEKVFKASYPRWEEFLAVREKADPENHFSSLLGQRLGLAPNRKSRTTARESNA